MLGKPVHRRHFLRTSLMAAGGAAGMGLLERTGLAQAVMGEEASASPLRAELMVDLTRVLHGVNPHIYGSFTEHIGRCIYGGIYEEGSPLSDEHGFRRDVIEAVKEWNVPIIRWPGGNFVSGYHWEDGIGPKAERPRKYNTAWYQEESNHFGTDEFVAFCRKVGAEPYICVNLGTGSVQDAANWVEYCNATTNTKYANLRRKYGSPEPHGVRYWGLGNEVYGQWQIGHKNAEDYSKIALEAAKMIKWVDPTVKLVACGSDDPNWNRVVLERVAGIVEYISLHDYEGTDDYYELLGTVSRFEDRIRRMDAVIEATDPVKTGRGDAVLALSLPDLKNKGRVQIACDEWNIWYRKWNIWRREIPNPVEEIYNLRDALWIATVLNLFQRRGDVVTMANLAQMVNVIAPIFTSKDGVFRQTIFFPLQLYRNHCGNKYVASYVTSPTFSSKTFKDVPYLDVSATTDGSQRRLSVAVVNRHETAPISAAVTLRGVEPQLAAEVFEINGPSPLAENSFKSPSNVGITRRPLKREGDRFVYTFPAHSVTLLKFGRP